MSVAVSRRRHLTGPRWSIRTAIIASVVLHGAVIIVALSDWRPLPPKAIPISFDVSFVAPPTPDPDEKAKPVPAPPAPPKKEEPKPEPKKEEPKKEEPKPEPKKEPEKVAEKKPEPKKEPEKKPEPKKEPPKKKEAPKKEPEKKSEPAPAKPSAVPAPEVVAKAPPASSGVQQSQLPSALNMWGRQVQRKVEKYWAAPGGLQLSPEDREVHISFWVDRGGMLLSQPEVVKAANASLAQSGINAIVSAQPLPPLPLEYAAEKQQVVYVFTVMDAVPTAGGTG